MYIKRNIFAGSFPCDCNLSGDSRYLITFNFFFIVRGFYLIISSEQLYIRSILKTIIINRALSRVIHIIIMWLQSHFILFYFSFLMEKYSTDSNCCIFFLLFFLQIYKNSMNSPCSTSQSQSNRRPSRQFALLTNGRQAMDPSRQLLLKTTWVLPLFLLFFQFIFYFFLLCFVVLFKNSTRDFLEITHNWKYMKNY